KRYCQWYGRSCGAAFLNRRLTNGRTIGNTSSFENAGAHFTRDEANKIARSTQFEFCREPIPMLLEPGSDVFVEANRHSDERQVWSMIANVPRDQQSSVITTMRLGDVLLRLAVFLLAEHRHHDVKKRKIETELRADEASCFTDPICDEYAIARVAQGFDVWPQKRTVVVNPKKRRCVRHAIDYRTQWFRSCVARQFRVRPTSMFVSCG